MERRVVKDFWPYEPAPMVYEDAELFDIIQHFIENPCLHHVCVIDKRKKLLGLINRKRMFKRAFSHFVATESPLRDLFTLLTAETSGQIMITHIISTTEDATIDSVISTLIEHDIREMPVTDKDNTVLGFITISMILREWVRDRESMNH